ncbi:hypothetical protein QQ008_27175 [Fulvivirgaceae bacterium BMA10]|uniref:Uncharacterized protein n=1 Tax=Splendidivirga corallicola TaxID=3051826 RepID=A0ABT8KWE6_9BACT|nr:hypothetical protein [Fulvivirgaceae bacterium BMA10]
MITVYGDKQTKAVESVPVNHEETQTMVNYPFIKHTKVLEIHRQKQAENQLFKAEMIGSGFLSPHLNPLLKERTFLAPFDLTINNHVIPEFLECNGRNIRNLPVLCGDGGLLLMD